jgi:hypothetical protein
MITAIDSSVLWAILKQEPGHEGWLQGFRPRKRNPVTSLYERRSVGHDPSESVFV